MTRKFKTAGTLMALVVALATAAPAAQASGFTSSSYPAHLTASSTAEVFDFFGHTMTCENDLFTASLSAPSSTLKVTPSYQKCTLSFWSGFPFTVNFTGCDYLFHKNTGVAGTMDIACPGPGKTIDITLYQSSSHAVRLCEIQIPEQAGKSGYTLTNEAGTVKLSGTIGSLTVKIVHRTSIICPAGPEDTGAKYTIQASGIVFSGNNGALSVD